MDKIRIIFLGGQDELFKTVTAIEINDEIYVIECGNRLPDKNQPGIDYVTARLDYLVENKNKVRGYFITHGHDSIFGGLPYIYDKVPAPIYCTKTTKKFFDGFCVHNHIDNSKYNFVVVNPTTDLLLVNRRIRLFQTCSNVAESCGICISTDQGNIVYLGAGIVLNEVTPGFIYDMTTIATIAAEKTLVLLADSIYTDREGYCSPKHRLYPSIMKDLIGVQGRIFVAIDSPDLFNIIDFIKGSLKNGRKIIPYDKASVETLDNLVELGFVEFKKNDIAPLEDVNRLPPQEVVVFITGFTNALNNKITLLAYRNNDEKLVFLNETDTFIFANHITYATELTSTEALDALYHNDCKIVKVPQKAFVRMHGYEEDLKSVLSAFKPRYFIPIMAPFKQLLSAAKTAVSMNIGLNHNNVFVCDNGDAVSFEAGFAKVSPNAVIHGDLFINGKNSAETGAQIFEERQKFSDDGLIVLAATISKSQRKIIAGPDIQARGFVFIKDSETLMKEINRIFVNTINNELAKENYSLSYLENAVKDIMFKFIARSLNKNPIVIPYIAEVQ